MQIGSVGSLSSHVSTSLISQPEHAERGPDHDNDGDEGQRVTSTAPSSAQAAGPGKIVNILA